MVTHAPVTQPRLSDPGEENDLQVAPRCPKEKKPANVGGCEKKKKKNVSHKQAINVTACQQASCLETLNT